jgi:hypothetical protein
MQRAFAVSLALVVAAGCQPRRLEPRCSHRVDVLRLEALCAALEQQHPTQPGSARANLIQMIGGRTWHSHKQQDADMMCGQVLIRWWNPESDEPCPGRPRPDCYRFEVQEIPEPKGLLEMYRVDRMWRLELEGWQDEQRICRSPLRGNLFPQDVYEIDGAPYLGHGLIDHVGPDPIYPTSLAEWFETF